MNEIEFMVNTVRELHNVEDTSTLDSLQLFIELQFGVSVNKKDLEPYILIEQEDLFLQKKHN